MIQLALDIGNSFSKAALFSGKQMLAFQHFKGDDPEMLLSFFHEYGMPDVALISAVRPVGEALIGMLNSHCQSHFLTHETPLPFTITYAGAASLGRDRIAGVAAAFGRFPAKNVLVIDMGTCITYDLLQADGVWPGGIISPGLKMRLKAMHHFTGRLPLVELPDETPLTGTNTAGALASGALCGAKAEIAGIIAQYQNIYNDLTVLLGGGDNKYFDRKLRISIFAAPNLVIEGLKIIMDFNKLG